MAKWLHKWVGYEQNLCGYRFFILLSDIADRSNYVHCNAWLPFSYLDNLAINSIRTDQ